MRTSWLSVSSNGSNGLQPAIVTFKPIFYHPLSVSSNGSNGLQRDLDVFLKRLVRSFSILERIEWAATGIARHITSGNTKPFSILERIEWAAT